MTTRRPEHRAGESSVRDVVRRDIPADDLHEQRGLDIGCVDAPARVETPGRLNIARQAVHLGFFIFGFVVAAMGVHVPSIRAHYRLDDAELSVALLCVAIGAVFCLVFAGRLIARHGARRVAWVAACAMGLSLALLLQFDQPAWLIVVMMAFGAAVGLFDVAINTEGSFIEVALERKVMSVMHGMWSLGGMTGAALGAWMLERQIAPLAQLRSVAAIGIVVAVSASLGMLPLHQVTGAATPLPGRGWSTMPRAARRALAVLGVLAILGLLAEGAIYDWSVLYLQRELAAKASLAALGFAIFSAAMAGGRFAGDWLRARLAPTTLLAASATLSACAMSAVLLSAQVWVALAGLACVGLGLANVIPLLFVAASRVDGASPAAGIALVSSLGWVGVVVGPPLVGGVAQATSLTWGLTLVVVASAALAVSARRLAPGPAVTIHR